MTANTKFKFISISNLSIVKKIQFRKKYKRLFSLKAVLFRYCNSLMHLEEFKAASVPLHHPPQPLPGLRWFEDVPSGEPAPNERWWVHAVVSHCQSMFYFSFFVGDQFFVNKRFTFILFKNIYAIISFVLILWIRISFLYHSECS